VTTALYHRHLLSPSSGATDRPLLAALPMNVQWPTVAIVGVGLIGGSVGLALHQRRLSHRVIGVGRSLGSLETARQRGCIDESTTELEPAVAGADLVLVASPVGTVATLLERIDAAVRPGTPITDAGSTKASIVAFWEKGRRGRRGRFVGGHPLAGSHERGPGAADPQLFDGRITILTPVKSTPTADLESVGGFWSSLGATVFTMPPRDHDRLLATTSHAPHLLAAALAAATPAESRRFTAGGWRDTTRIAAGDPELWADILLDNAPAVARAASRVAAEMEKLLTAIEDRDRRKLVRLLARAKGSRDALGS
jgi:prephenate dehydrogenase